MAAITARELRERTFYTATVPFLGDRVEFTMKRLQVQTVVWSGVITLEMANAVDKYMAVYAQIVNDEKAGLSAFEVGKRVLAALTDADKDLLMQFLHRFVCEKVIEPKLARGNPSDEDAYPVENLPFETLVAIFAALPANPSPSETFQQTAAAELSPEASQLATAIAETGGVLEPKPAAEVVSV